jgi:YVTN family beta-propeller protein
MRLKLASATAAMSVVAGLATPAVVLTGATAWADGTAALPLSHYSHMVVDAAHQHIFFSQGAGSTDILVTDLSGARVTTITGEPGATGLALSADGGALYAALADGDAVSAIDTATLTESARYPTGAGSRPVSVAVAGGMVWYGYTAGDAGGIGRLDPAAADPAATPQPGMSHWSTAPLLAAGGRMLAAEEPDQNLSHIATFGLSSGDTSVKADTSVYGGTAAGLQVTADGGRVLLAAPQGAGLYAYRTSDLGLASPNVYYTGGVGSRPNSVAPASDGTVAAGSTSGSAAGLYLYAGSNLAENHVTFAGTVAPDGLAWGADGLTLYAVVTDASGAYTLDVLSDPKLTDTQLSLKYPSYAVPTQPFVVSGSLSTRGFIPAGAALQVTVNGTALPDATVGADGSFSVSDTRQSAGAYTYQVSFAGDATHRPATASLNVNVAKLTTTIPYPSLGSVTPRSVVFTGTLMSQLNLGSLPDGTTVQVARRNEDTQETVTLPSVPVDPATTEFTVTDAPNATGRFTYLLSYAGDATHEGTVSEATIEVSPYAPALTLTAPATATRGSALKISGSLDDAPYDSGETVTVSRTDAAHTTAPVQWSVPIGTDGTIAVKDTPAIGGANTYTVTYPGDATHQAATASAIVQVSRAATALSVTTNASSYSYGAMATVTAHLGTTYDSRTVAIYAQPYGGTKSLVKIGTVDSHGNLTAGYKLAHNTTFTAAFTGDYRYAPATASHVVYDHVKVAESVGGYYTSTKYGSTVYRVFHHTVKPQVSAVVTPGKPGQCERFQVQQYYSGAWHTLTTSPCFALDSGSHAAASLTLSNAVGKRFRVRSEYVHSSTDNTNLSTWGGWLYLTVRT